MRNKKSLTPTQVAILAGIGGFWLATLLVFGGYLIYSMRQPVALNVHPATMPTRISTQAPKLTLTPTLPVLASPTTRDVVRVDGCPPVEARRQKGFVIDVLDGTNLKVKIDNSTYTVSYLGVLTLNGTNYADKSKQKNAELIQGQSIILLSGPIDKRDDGTLLRYVYAGDTFVNLELIKQGYAAWERKDLLDKECQTVFMNAAQVAIDTNVGYFADGATESAKQQATIVAGIPTQAPQNPPRNPVQNPPQNICDSPTVIYNKDVHRINLQYLNDYYGTWINYYQQIIDQALRDRDALTFSKAQRSLDEYKKQYADAVDAENASYRASVPKACR